MPINDKRDRNSWYNSIRVNRDPWKYFSAEHRRALDRRV